MVFTVLPLVVNPRQFQIDTVALRADRSVRRWCEKLEFSPNGHVRVTCDSAALTDASFMVDAIVDRARALAHDEALLRRMAAAASTTAADHTIERYGQRLLAALP